MALAGKSEQPLEVDALAHDVASLMQCTIPVVGIYQVQPFRSLVDEAVDRLRDNLFSRSPKNRNALGMASCCHSWGEVRSLEALGHPPAKIIKFDNRKLDKQLTKESLKGMVLGNSPDPWKEPWQVFLPKLLVQCTAQSKRKYRFVVEATETPQENATKDEEGQGTLGKRSVDALAPLPQTKVETAEKTGSPSSADLTRKLEGQSDQDSFEESQQSNWDAEDVEVILGVAYMKRTLEEVGSKKFYQIMKKAYLSHPIHEWPLEEDHM